MLDAERAGQVKGRVTQEAIMVLSGQWAAGNEPFPKETDIKTRAGGVAWGKEHLEKRTDHLKRYLGKHDKINPPIMIK